MMRFDIRTSSYLMILSALTVCTEPLSGQQSRMRLDDDLRQAQTSRMSLDDADSEFQTARMRLDDALAAETARMSLDVTAAAARTARMSLDDTAAAARTARMSLDDSIFASPLARRSLDEFDMAVERVNMSFSDHEASLVNAYFPDQEPALADCLCSGTSETRPQWLKAGYLMMWTKGSRLPALVTTSNAADAGILGRASTSIVFGDADIDEGHRNGLRLNYGHWLSPNQNMAFEVDYFSAFDDASSGDYTGGSTGSPVLARPFYNASTLLEDARLIESPGVSEGQVNISNTSESHSVALLLRNNLRCGPGGRIDVLSGYRHFRYRDGIRIHENRVTPIPGGTSFNGYDQFRSENEFHGGEIGVHSKFYRGTVTLDVLAKVAIGGLRHDALVDGRTTTTIPGVFPLTSFSEGGLLTTPTSINRHSAKSFAALPELGVSATVPLTKNVSFQAGYTVLWLNDVVRAADLIDRRVNPTQLLGGTLVGDAFPTALHTKSDFWMQGVNFMFLIEG